MRISHRRLACLTALALLVPIPTHAVGGGERITGSPLVVPIINPLNPKMAGCSGALIAPRLVYTAAHCLDDQNHNRRFSGPLAPRTFIVGEPGVDVGRGKKTWPIAAFLSELYRPSQPNVGPMYDFAVLVLAEPLSARTFRVATQAEITDIRTNQRTVFGLGYGYHSYTELDTGREPYPAQAVGTIKLDSNSQMEAEPANFPVQIPEMMVKTKWLPGIFTGGGDSGGPLWFKDAEEWVYIGATSGANGPHVLTPPQDPVWNDPYWSKNQGASYFSAQAFPEVITAARNFLDAEEMTRIAAIQVELKTVKRRAAKLERSLRVRLKTLTRLLFG